MSDNSKYAVPATDESINFTKRALEDNGFKVIVVNSLEDAKKEVLSQIPEGSEVYAVSSVTSEQSGIMKEIDESGKYKSVRKEIHANFGNPDKAKEMKELGSTAEYTVGSVHALTEDGQAMIASATGSQLAPYVFGSSHVFWVVGSQKIVKDLSVGFDRIENYTYYLEDKRALVAYGSHSSLNKILIYKKETSQRVTIIIIKESVGF